VKASGKNLLQKILKSNLIEEDQKTFALEKAVSKKILEVAFSLSMSGLALTRLNSELPSNSPHPYSYIKHKIFAFLKVINFCIFIKNIIFNEIKSVFFASEDKTK
jgi:hypothetical protein